MKNLYFLFAFVFVGMLGLGASPWAATPGDLPALKVSSKPIIIPSAASLVYDPSGYMLAEKIFDDTLPAGNDTLAGPVIDIRRVIMNRMIMYDSTNHADLVQRDSTLGKMHISCYDVNDSAAVTDSISVKAWVRGYDYASDNINPLAPFGPTPFLVGDSTGVIAALSASNARKDTTYSFVLKTQAAKSTPFIRVVFRNISTAAQNKPRCRAWIYRKADAWIRR
jgi:hypothetical protein